ncbi:hypothetical protein HGRIS_001771 [Hohenbuehelia grisea]|uniref:Uncharacterized protein n=1 Tax=Hohenbuehelia grisea TaxID=104357 RepID=A0ABR3JIF1_9AGAR
MFKQLILLASAFALVSAVPAPGKPKPTPTPTAAAGPFTATRLYYTTTDVYPYLVTATTVIVWGGPTPAV